MTAEKVWRNQQLQVASLRTDGLQIRTTLNMKFINETLVPILKDGSKFKDEIVVFKDSAGVYWVADGHHRVRAHEEARMAVARCEVHKGEFVEALRYALQANAEHGQRRDDDTMKHAVIVAFEKRAILWPDNAEMPSAGLIAQTVACSVEWASRHLSTVETWRASQKRTGADGKTYRVPPPRPKPTPPQKPAAAPVTPPKPLPGPRQQAPAEPLDALGVVIPDYLRGAWERSTGAIRDIVADLGRIRAQVAAEQAAGSGIFLDADLQAVHAALSTALDLRRSAPYAVCPWCQGGPTRKTCDGCKGAGMIGKHRWDTAVPSELKA